MSYSYKRKFEKVVTTKTLSQSYVDFRGAKGTGKLCRKFMVVEDYAKVISGYAKKQHRYPCTRSGGNRNTLSIAKQPRFYEF